jgi:hypothetical protein
MSLQLQISGRCHKNVFLGVLNHAFAWVKNTLWTHPCMSASFFTTMRLEGTRLEPNVGQHSDTRVFIVQIHCVTITWDHIFAKMTDNAMTTSDHIGATIAYVMCHEENFWNVSVLQRVHLSNLLCLLQECYKLQPLLNFKIIFLVRCSKFFPIFRLY